MSRELRVSDWQVVDEARLKLEKSPDKDKFGLVAAISCDGGIFTAFNLFKEYWGPSVCGEVGALAIAQSELAPQIATPNLVAAVKFDPARESIEVVNSCGTCLQWISDLYPECEFVVAESDGTVAVATTQEVMRYGYNQNRGQITPGVKDE